MSTRINVDRLQEDLRTKRLGRNILFSCSVGSTNEWAKELALLGAAEGTVTIAETQTAGRGRLGREWFSSEGGLWFSVVLRPKLRASEAVGLVFVAGLAVAEVLGEKYGLQVETKWPNDVLVKGRKVCGILVETNTTGETLNFSVVGIGINGNFDVEEAFPEELRKVATSLEKEIGKKVNLEQLFRSILERLEDICDLLLKEGSVEVLRKWKRYAGFLGCRVEVKSDDDRWIGLALDVDDDGSLVVRLRDGEVMHFFAGDVSICS